MNTLKADSFMPLPDPIEFDPNEVKREQVEMTADILERDALRRHSHARRGAFYALIATVLVLAGSVAVGYVVNALIFPPSSQQTAQARSATIAGVDR